MAGLDTTFLNTVTREKFIKVLKNQVYDKMVLFNRLVAKGRVQSMTGRSLLWDVVAKKHAAVGIYTGYDTLASPPVNPIVQASLNTANYYATLAMSGEEERKNSGSMERLLDMAKIQFDNASATMRDRMSTDFYGSNATIGGRTVLNGLGLICTNATGTYANINRATTGNEFWRSNVDATSHTFANLNDPTSTSYLPAVMRSSYTAASYDNAPDIIVTTKAVYNLYQNSASGQNLRFNNEVANLGFGGVEFGPGVTMVFDAYEAAGYMHMLSTPAFSVFVYDGANFDMKEPGWQIPDSQDAKVAHIIWSGQVRCDCPREQATVTTIATA